MIGANMGNGFINQMTNVFTNVVLLNLEAQQKGQTNKEILEKS